MESMIEQAIRQSVTEQKAESDVIETVMYIAGHIFEECTEDRNDFGIQNISVGSSIIFGGLNRLRLDRNGWTVSYNHCTESFRKNFEKKFDPIYPYR
jgi:hypothetical protein